MVDADVRAALEDIGQARLYYQGRAHGATSQQLYEAGLLYEQCVGCGAVTGRNLKERPAPPAKGKGTK